MRRNRHQSALRRVVLVAIVAGLASLPLAPSATACIAMAVEEGCLLGPTGSCCPLPELERLAPAELCCRTTVRTAEVRASVPSAEGVAACEAAPSVAWLPEARTQPLPPLLDAGPCSLLSAYCVYRI